MKKFMIVLSFSLGLVSYAEAQLAQKLICSAALAPIEISLASEVVATEKSLNDSVQILTRISNSLLSRMNAFDSYSDELKVAEQRLEDLVMFVKNPYRSMNEIRNKFLEIESQLNVQTNGFKDTTNGNQAKWSIRKNFYEYKLSKYQAHLSNLRKTCKN